MGNKIILSLYANSRGAVIGNLQVGEQRVLATTHPATIAAAIFAMVAGTMVFKSEKGEAEVPFPIMDKDFETIASLLDNFDQVFFMNGFVTFSRFDFLHPMPWDNHAELHLRVAVHHMDEQLVSIAPLSPHPKGFKKELRIRNNFVYFPYC